MNRWLLSATIASLYCLPGFAQETDNASPNLVHSRHTHPHNQKHPTAEPSEDRFTTSREGAVLALTDERPMFSFAVFGDRTGGPASGVNILADAVRDVNLLEPDLVMTVGDLVEGYNQRGEWMTQMTEYKSIMDNLLCPWFPVAGNHDIYWRGPDRPPEEHEPAYETHFGPLWYAFEHKDCWFIVLYSDEPDPATGERNFSKPASQRMSPEQFTWLQETLVKAKDAPHIFLFLHHPRWIGGNYGDDWERVHQALVGAGNVSAVFAGHVHYMRFDPRDGINYVTLATTGGHQPGSVPSAGYLHHYHVVTVRENQLGITAYPVGEAIDVREITPELLQELQGLAGAPIRVEPSLAVSADGSLRQDVRVSLDNPSSHSVELTLTPGSPDSRWNFVPDHLHLQLAPGESKVLPLTVTRLGNSLDPAFAPPSIEVLAESLTATSRYPLPIRKVHIPFSFEALPTSGENLAMDFNGRDQYLSVPSASIAVPDKLTIETWFKGRLFGPRVGLATKTESSDYGLFVSAGRPNFSIFIGDSYLVVEAPQPMLQTDTWHHLAGVYDGREARLYLDGKLVGAARREGSRRTNDLPLLIGADVTGQGQATSHFSGLIDAVRLSTEARYTGESFTPPVDFADDAATALLLDMDLILGDLACDRSRHSAHATLHNGPASQPRR